MTKELSTTQDLADQINEQHRLALKAAQSAIHHARQAGELLIEAKQQIKHGEWIPWLEANCEVGPRQAQKYMRLVKVLPKTNCDSYLTIDRALEAIAADKEMQWEKAVRLIAEYHAYDFQDVEAIEDPEEKLHAYIRIALNLDLERMVKEIRLRAERNIRKIQKGERRFFDEPIRHV